MTSPLRVAQVFVPGKLPAHTYNPRASRALEQQLTSYLEEGGAILTIAGPTKTGKSVLVKTVIENTVFVDGQGIEDVDELWARMADQPGVFTSIQFEAGDERTTEGQISSEAGIAFVKVAARGSLSGTQSRASTYGAERPLSAVVGESLSVSGRPLVIDDFHFISRPAQRQVVRALKPLVLAGAPVISSQFHTAPKTLLRPSRT